MKTMKIERIYPNPNQPRKYFDQTSLEELAQSIKENGLIEPIIVTKRGKRYMIIAGERRWRACGIAGIDEILILVKKADNRTVAELALLENLQRKDLNILEEAKAFEGLVNMGMSHEEIARKMGMKGTFRIEWRLSLLNLEQIYQEYAIKGILNPTQAREISRLPKEQQKQVFDKISTGKLNTYEKLRSFVNALLFVKEQESFIPEPTPEDRAVYTKYDQIIKSLVNLIDRSFNRDDLSVLSSILSPAARENVNHIDAIVAQLCKIKKALLQSASNGEALEQSTMTM